MQKIEWNDAYSVNNIEIDEQHKQWVSIYNEMYDQLGNKKREEGDPDLRKTLKSILDYTRYHFDSEREYMKSIDYPHIVEHLRKHKDFDDLVYRINRSVADGKIVLYSEIMTLIKQWFLEHILGDDKKYSLFASGQDV